MTRTELDRLMERAEGETLDFKRDAYDLQEDRNSFIKDVLAMANTPREGDAHIVLGVQWTAENGHTIVGLREQFDDSQFQGAFGQDRVQPRVRFTYHPYELDGKKVGVLQIPPETDGPYTSVKDFGSFLQAGTVYYRRGTTNERAVGAELKKVADWFAGRCTQYPQVGVHNPWKYFIDSVHSFAPTRSYIFAADRIPVDTNAPLHALALVPWRGVIDFDPASDERGLLHAIANSLGKHRVIHRIVRREYGVHAAPGTHWFLARGLLGRQETLADGDHRSWLRMYKPELGKQLSDLAAAVSPMPVTVVVAWSDPSLRNHLRTLVEEVHGAFGDAGEVTVVSSDGASLEEICRETDVTFVQMGLRSLCAGIACHFADLQGAEEGRYVLPMSDGAAIEIGTEDRLWFSEDIDVLYRGTGLQGGDLPDEFRRGADVSWRNLQLRHDCDREVTASLRAQVESDLQTRQTVRINLYHAPGAGGTTVGRRIAWDIHDMRPVCILRKCNARFTAERIAKVSALTGSALLLLVDGGQHSERDIDDLYEYLRAGQTPVVLLQVLRRFQSPGRGKSRQFWLSDVLTDAEADSFRDAYTRTSPAKGNELKELASKRGDRTRIAFFFGLAALGQDFRGLHSYVKTRIERLTDDQKRILIYISLAHYYGQQSVPAQAFASLLKLPRSRSLEFTDVFKDRGVPALELLVETQKGEWRATHQLIALEILQQSLAPQESQEQNKVWRQNLSDYAKDFAALCRGEGHAPSERLLELARRVFIYRDNTELLGTERAGQKQFAQLIDEIPSEYGRINVLRHLTELFPLEPHFHAHLGRYLGLRGDIDEALKALDTAVSLQPNDHVLHHMRGMIFRYAIKGIVSPSRNMEKILEYAKKASESFEKARQLSPDLEHGYISEVQMLLAVLDCAGATGGDSVRDVLARPETDAFLKGAMDRAEDLLDRVQHLYAGEEPSEYVVDCRARLDRIYGDYQTALQAWDSLLARGNVTKPPLRRQIVWTILHRSKGAWQDLRTKDVDRIGRLLRENLEEDPNDSASLRLWLRLIRQAQTAPSLDSVIEKVAYWKANTGALDAAYYLYVLYALRALEGSGQALADAERALEACRSLARFRRDRTRSFEWIGPGEGVHRLLHQSRLGEWKGDFWESTGLLERLTGRVASIEAPQKGSVELHGGLKAFFVPARANLSLGRDENVLITCYVGFSYDGPRAWNVTRENV